MILAIFYLQVTLMLPTKFQVNWPFGTGEEKNWFSRWQPWLPSQIFDQNDFSDFWSASHLNASYQGSSQLAFRFRRRSKKQHFQDGCHLGFPIGTILAIFIYKSPRSFLPSVKSIGLSVQEKKWKIDFQDGDQLLFSTQTILATFDLQVTPMLPTKFQVNWPSSSEETKNKFSRWWPSLISDRNDFHYFKSTSHPDASYQVSSQSAFWFRRRSEK